VILISGEYDTGQKIPPALQAALQVPMMTATAHWHRRLPADLQAMTRDEAVARATAWARTQYAPMLEKAATLTPDERAQLLAQLQRYTGVAPGFVDQKTLRLSKDVDLERLLDDEQRELGRYDSRLSAPRRNLALTWMPTGDPSILPVLDLMQGTSPSLIAYLSDTLGYRTDLLYKGPFGEGFHPEPLTYFVPHGVSDDWMTMLWDRKPVTPIAGAPPQISEPPLRRAMEVLPGLRVLNVVGMYDESCAAKDEALARTDQQLQSRVRNACYPAGHMIYTDVAVRRAFKRDFDRLVEEATHVQHSDGR
jgi:carboxypeptidase C (cathepsin A)